MVKQRPYYLIMQNCSNLVQWELVSFVFYLGLNACCPYSRPEQQIRGNAKHVTCPTYAVCSRAWLGSTATFWAPLGVSFLPLETGPKLDPAGVLTIGHFGPLGPICSLGLDNSRNLPETKVLPQPEGNSLLQDGVGRLCYSPDKVALNPKSHTLNPKNPNPKSQTLNHQNQNPKS